MGGFFGTGIGPEVGPDVDWKQVGATIGGGPIGYLGYQAYKNQQEGNEAANNAMASAQGHIKDLQAKQRGQRQVDINRALAFFDPANQLLKRMYGTAMPGAYIPPGMETARSGPGHFGASMQGNAPPPPSPPSMGGPSGPMPMRPPPPDPNAVNRQGGYFR